MFARARSRRDEPVEAATPTVPKEHELGKTSPEPGAAVPADPGLGPWRTPILAAGALLLLGGIVLRFITRSPLWLDEALSVNIAKLPLGQIPEALRHDGHPPLYYALLHGWMALFGQSDFAVRTLSGLFGVAVLPLTWVAGRRLGGPRVAWIAAALMALSPFAIRYSTETRMYSLVMVLVLGGWLLAEDALDRPTRARLAGLVLISAGLLYAHYWAMWLLASAGVGLLVRLRRAHHDRRSADRAATFKVLAALAGGAVLFLPWVPNLLYQGAHTGTPWAGPVRPPDIVSRSLADFGGGPQGEAICLGWFLAVFALLGLFGRRIDDRHIELDLASRPEARPLGLLVVLTISIASVVGYATNSTYASRYAAVLFPFFVLLAGLGVARIGSRPILFATLTILVGLGLVGAARNVVTGRTQAVVSARAIESKGSRGDYVVYCPDQLGPSLSRVLSPGFRQVTYPDFAAPQRVNWVDYVDRLHRQDPDRFATELVRRAAGQRILLVWDSSYLTHKQICPDLVHALQRRRPELGLTQSEGGMFFESENVELFAPPPPPAGG